MWSMCENGVTYKFALAYIRLWQNKFYRTYIYPFSSYVPQTSSCLTCINFSYEHIVLYRAAPLFWLLTSSGLLSKLFCWKSFENGWRKMARLLLTYSFAFPPSCLFWLEKEREQPHYYFIPAFLLTTLSPSHLLSLPQTHTLSLLAFRPLYYFTYILNLKVCIWKLSSRTFCTTILSLWLLLLPKAKAQFTPYASLNSTHFIFHTYIHTHKRASSCLQRVKSTMLKLFKPKSTSVSLLKCLYITIYTFVPLNTKQHFATLEYIPGGG